MTDDILFVTLDSCRFDTFEKAFDSGLVPNIASIGPLHKAFSPSYFTYGSHAAFWMGFTPGVVGCESPFLNPKAGKLFRLTYSGFIKNKNDQGLLLQGKNIIDGLRNSGYSAIGTGSVEWFNTSTDTGSVLAEPFEHFWFSGNTWSLNAQLSWINERLSELPEEKPRFVFLNVGETHVPYWHEGASWERWPSPCVPFGNEHCSATECSQRQTSCLEWVDRQLATLLDSFQDGTVLICADHGDCWGEDGLWEHGISHPATLTVPLLLRVRGVPVEKTQVEENVVTSPSRFRSAFSRLKRWLKARL